MKTFCRSQVIPPMIEDYFPTAMNRPDLSVVIPFLNEEQVLPLLHVRLEKFKIGQSHGNCSL